MEPSQEREQKGGQDRLSAFLKSLFRKGWFRAGLIALLLFIVVRSFFLDLFIVNNRDMEDSYREGDVLLVSKLFANVERNQVFQIRYPIIEALEEPVSFIQRVIALPGDTLLITDKHVYLNGLGLDDSPDQKHNYFVKSRKLKLDSAFFARYQLTEGGSVSEGFDYSFSLNLVQKQKLEKDSAIESIKIKTEQKNMFDITCFPGSPHYSWNSDHYGKIYIPKKKDRIALDTTVIALYEDLITTYENNRLEIRQDSIFVNGKYTTEYPVKYDYFFFLGDNRDNARDSRHWGFIPRSYIMAKVLCQIKERRP